MKAVSFRVVDRDREAKCEACGELIVRRDDGAYEVSPHLREKHGFTDGPIDFERTAQVICPPMQVYEARQP